MRELPILMNGAMVRAVLEGRKTVTRRLLKRQPEPCCHRLYEEQAKSPVPTRWTTDATGDFYCGVCGNGHELCRGAAGVRGLRPPYQVGDRLYVRETTVNVEDHGYLGPVFAVSDEGVAIRDGGLGPAEDDCEIDPEDIKLRTALHMPKAWARIWLAVTGVRVERLQDITEAQAHAEGVDNHMAAAAVRTSATRGELLPATVHGFAHLWDGLAKPGARWDDNPWVWVVEFKRIEKEVPHGK